MHIPPNLKKKQETLQAILAEPAFEQLKIVHPVAAHYLEEQQAGIEREIRMWQYLDRMKQIRAERSSRFHHQRGKLLLNRTNPKGMRGILMDTGEGPYIRFYSKKEEEKSTFKDYSFGWLVDVSITIEDGDHELKEFEREDGTILRVIEIGERAMRPEASQLNPGETTNNERL